MSKTNNSESNPLETRIPAIINRHLLSLKPEDKANFYLTFSTAFVSSPAEVLGIGLLDSDFAREVFFPAIIQKGQNLKSSSRPSSPKPSTKLNEKELEEIFWLNILSLKVLNPFHIIKSMLMFISYLILTLDSMLFSKKTKESNIEENWWNNLAPYFLAQNIPVTGLCSGLLISFCSILRTIGTVILAAIFIANVILDTLGTGLDYVNYRPAKLVLQKMQESTFLGESKLGMAGRILIASAVSWTAIVATVVTVGIFAKFIAASYGLSFVASLIPSTATATPAVAGASLMVTKLCPPPASKQTGPSIK